MFLTLIPIEHFYIVQLNEYSLPNSLHPLLNRKGQKTALSENE